MSPNWPRFVIELEVDEEDGSWHACDIWPLDTVTAADVERLMREVGVLFLCATDSVV